MELRNRELPEAPPEKSGWPWQAAVRRLPEKMPTGQPRALERTALAQIDTAFVKENGFFRQSHFVATAQQRMALLRHNNIPEALAALRSRSAVSR